MDLVKQFSLDLYQNKELKGDPEFSCQGVDMEWCNYQTIYFPGFDGRITVSLQDVWQAAMKDKSPIYIATVIGYETIVKFANTMQLKTNYTVKIIISYR